MLILSFDWILRDSLKKDLQENVPWLLKRRFRRDLFDSNMELLFRVGLEWALDHDIFKYDSLSLKSTIIFTLDISSRHVYVWSIACNIKMPYVQIFLEKLRLSYVFVSNSFLEFFSNTTLDNRNYLLTILGKDLNCFKVRAKMAYCISILC